MCRAQQRARARTNARRGLLKFVFSLILLPSRQQGRAPWLPHTLTLLMLMLCLMQLAGRA
jgi:hypothetical protein